MAKTATASQVANDVRPADFAGAVVIIRGKIKTLGDKVSSVNGEVAAQWKLIEDKKVDKRAAKIFASLDKLEEEDRIAVMRSLNGLIDVAEWPEEAEDLVDQAEGTKVSMRVGGDDGGEGGGEETVAETPAPEKPKRGRPSKKAEAAEAPAEEDGGGAVVPFKKTLDAAKKHLGGQPDVPDALH